MTRIQDSARSGLGVFMIAAGLLHLTVARREFQKLVPDWVPGDKDDVVVASGAAEIALGTAFLALPKHRRTLGMAIALFITAVFPGNMSQYIEVRTAFGLDTDAKRKARLFFQPPLVLWALWAGGWLKRDDSEQI